MPLPYNPNTDPAVVRPLIIDAFSRRTQPPFSADDDTYDYWLNKILTVNPRIGWEPYWEDRILTFIEGVTSPIVAIALNDVSTLNQNTFQGLTDQMGVDVAAVFLASIKIGTLRIEKTISRPETADFVVEDRDGTLPVSVGQGITIFGNLTTLFTGVLFDVSLSDHESPSGARQWIVKATGSTADANRLLTGQLMSFYTTDGGDVLSYLADLLGLGSLGSFSTALPFVFVTDREPAAAALNRLAGIATAETGDLYYWFIESGNIYFLTTLDTSLGIGPGIGTPLGLPVRAGSLRYNQSRQEFVNKIVFKPDKYTQPFEGDYDGTQTAVLISATSFDFGYPLAGAPSITMTYDADIFAQPTGLQERELRGGLLGTTDMLNTNAFEFWWATGVPFIIWNQGAIAGFFYTHMSIRAHVHLAYYGEAVNQGAINAFGPWEKCVNVGDSGNATGILGSAAAELSKRSYFTQSLRLQVLCQPGLFAPGDAVAVRLDRRDGKISVPSGYYHVKTRRYIEEQTLLWTELELFTGPLLPASAESFGGGA